jgi:hypothetical protein
LVTEKQLPLWQRIPQTLPQAPQLLGSEIGLTQAALQARRPGPQSSVHVPPTQYCPAAQAIPHPPQLAESFLMSLQLPLQLVRGPQAPLTPATQTPAVQVCPDVHAVPHPPQFALSVCGSTHTEPHLVSPPPQVTAQAPLLQTWPAAHTVPQAPQLPGSTAVSRHAPEHSVSPVPQLATHALPEQISPVAQVFPHEPQLLRSLVRFAQVRAAPEPHSVRPAEQES